MKSHSSYSTKLINWCTATERFPEHWKTALITPNFKSDAANLATNYRPISILQIFSKVLDKVVAHQLMAYLEDNNLLHTNQLGFLSAAAGLTSIFCSVPFSNNLSKTCRFPVTSVFVVPNHTHTHSCTRGSERRWVSHTLCLCRHFLNIIRESSAFCGEFCISYLSLLFNLHIFNNDIK